MSKVPQLDKCLKFIVFREVILYRVQLFLSPRTDLNFRHLSSCDTIDNTKVCSLLEGCFIISIDICWDWFQRTGEFIIVLANCVVS